MAWAIIESDNTKELNPPILLNLYGAIHLWVEGNPPTPTNLWIVIGDFLMTDSLRLIAIKANHVNTFTNKQNDVFTRANVSISDYGINKRKSFHMDIQVPQSIINNY